MTNETKHLIYWQMEWLKRFIRTTYHIFNRKAYHKFKNRKFENNVGFDAITFSEDEMFH